MSIKKISKSLLRKLGFALVKANESKYRKVSFSQCGEDLIVRSIFTQLGIGSPSYIDIGAHHPYYLSNTALFYEAGSRGINIEPDPVLFGSFTQYRKEDINLNIGISDDVSVLDFYIINNPVLNTFSKEEAENYHKEGDYHITKKIKIKVTTVTNVLDEFNEGKFPDFLSIDAEGVDEIIFNSLDFIKISPIVICVETISFSNKGKGEKNNSLIEFIKSKGYFLYADTYINSIFVKNDRWENQ